MTESNFDVLPKLRKDAIAVFSAGIDAVRGDHAVSSHCRIDGNVLHIDDSHFNLDRFERIFVTGAGKATAHMARAMETLLGDKIAGGVIGVKYGHGQNLKKIRVMEGGHPVFDQNSVKNAEAIVSMAENAGADDLVIFLLSGGASALMAKPAHPITIDEKQEAVKQLLSCGADIDAINTIRKHISLVKGGRLAEATYPATLLTLVISDVVGDPLDVIGSGPTVPDTTTYGDCLRIIERFGLSTHFPESIRERLEAGAAGRLPETPRADDRTFSRTRNHIIAANAMALKAARMKAESLGYNTVVLSSTIEGDTRAAARVLSSVAKEVKKTGNPAPPPACLLSGGETTVVVSGGGKGGRNQEFALSAAFEIAGTDNLVVLAGGTDGTDGPTDAAGGIVDGETVSGSQKKGIDAESHLARNDSYHFLSRTGELLVTGPTGTNVMDMHIFLVA